MAKELKVELKSQTSPISRHESNRFPSEGAAVVSGSAAAGQKSIWALSLNVQRMGVRIGERDCGNTV